MSCDDFQGEIQHQTPSSKHLSKQEKSNWCKLYVWIQHHYRDAAFRCEGRATVDWVMSWLQRCSCTLNEAICIRTTRDPTAFQTGFKKLAEGFHWNIVCARWAMHVGIVSSTSDTTTKRHISVMTKANSDVLLTPVGSFDEIYYYSKLLPHWSSPFSKSQHLQATKLQFFSRGITVAPEL